MRDPLCITVAAVQVTTVEGEPQENVSRALALAREAALSRAEYICLPEGLTTGYGADFAQRVAEPVPGPTTAQFAGLARELKTYIAFGLAERDGDNCYNTAVAVGPHGLVGKHRKVHLIATDPTPSRVETGHYWPGDGFHTLTLDSVRVGLLISDDGYFDQSWIDLYRQDTNVIFYLNNRYSLLETGPSLTQKARDYGLPVAAANRSGPYAWVFRGESIIVEETGTVRVCLPPGEGVALARVSIANSRGYYSPEACL